MSEYQDDAVLQHLVKKHGIPARETHVHSECGHGCACYAPTYDKCRPCRNKDANERMAADASKRA